MGRAPAGPGAGHALRAAPPGSDREGPGPGGGPDRVRRRRFRACRPGRRRPSPRRERIGRLSWHPAPGGRLVEDRSRRRGRLGWSTLLDRRLRNARDRTGRLLRGRRLLGSGDRSGDRIDRHREQGIGDVGRGRWSRGSGRGRRRCGRRSGLRVGCRRGPGDRRGCGIGRRSGRDVRARGRLRLGGCRSLRGCLGRGGRRRSGHRQRPGLRRNDYDGRGRIGRRGLRRRGLRCRGRRRSPDGQESERVHVALRVGGDPHAEVDEAGRPGGADSLTLADGRTSPDRERAEVEQGHRVAVRREDRDRRTAPGHGPGEGDSPCRRREHRLAGRGRDVDPPVLAARVRVGRVEHERPQHVPARGPRPRPRPRHGDEQERRGEQSDAAHGGLLVVSFGNESRTLAAGPAVVNSAYRESR